MRSLSRGFQQSTTGLSRDLHDTTAASLCCRTQCRRSWLLHGPACFQTFFFFLSLSPFSHPSGMLNMFVRQTLATSGAHLQDVSLSVRMTALPRCLNLFQLPFQHPSENHELLFALQCRSYAHQERMKEIVITSFLFILSLHILSGLPSMLGICFLDTIYEFPKKKKQ